MCRFTKADKTNYLALSSFKPNLDEYNLYKTNQPAGQKPWTLMGG